MANLIDQRYRWVLASLLRDCAFNAAPGALRSRLWHRSTCCQPLEKSTLRAPSRCFSLTAAFPAAEEHVAFELVLATTVVTDSNPGQTTADVSEPHWSLGPGLQS